MSMLDDVKDLPTNKWGMISDKRFTDMVVAAARQARQFIFNEEASLRIGEMIRDDISLFVDNLDFAIPPYDPCYIEVDLDRMYSVLKKDMPPDPTADKRVGFLFVKNLVFSLVNSEVKPLANLAMYGTAFTNGPMPPTRWTANDQPELLEFLLLGSSRFNLNEVQVREFCRRFTVFHTLRPELFKMLPDKQRTPNFAGEARTIAVLLLMLYNRKHLIVTERPAQRMLSRGKLRTYMAHSVVELSLTAPVEIRRALGKGEGTPKRRHEVRTHYAHRRLGMRCEHTWVRNDYADNDQWECTKCGGLRFLRREHLRGDGTIGFVTKKYEVKP